MKKETESWPVKYIVPVVATIIATRLLFYFTGFDYSLFRDPFNMWFFIIDIAVFASIFWICLTLWNKLLQKYRRTAQAGQSADNHD
ncbi:hypothetical protein CWE09_07440 [Aliidiomarina minuta]|uniref:Uncharacterized protein n=1 Tax=Aliidiomarina minuta TaxID=880057 RepID=A0A432W8X0_9GAMM|nr:hypothetical protein [Aliidiomarina minuta]RUO26532.1 hypothetical protein CWE09_07440 [Aliidiomarina minuta]